MICPKVVLSILFDRNYRKSNEYFKEIDRNFAYSPSNNSLRILPTMSGGIYPRILSRISSGKFATCKYLEDLTKISSQIRSVNPFRISSKIFHKFFRNLFKNFFENSLEMYFEINSSVALNISTHMFQGEAGRIYSYLGL